jgi:hypothetical protein
MTSLSHGGPRRRSLFTVMGALLVAQGLVVPPAALAASSDDGVWVEQAPAGGDSASSAQATPRVFELNADALHQILDRAPLEAAEADAKAQPILNIPMPDGRYARFRVQESPILAPALAVQHPELKTWVAQGVDEPRDTARLDWTPDGFHAMVLSAEGSVFVDPLPGDTNRYASVWKAGLEGQRFTCLVAAFGRPPESALGGSSLVPSGNNLRTYRTAITATGEYTTFFGGVAQAQARITTTVNRVTGIFEREVAIRLNLVAFNVYPNAGTDPFPTGTVVDGALLTQNDNDLDANVGAANYDIGHIFSQGGGGGLAQTPCVCGGSKGRGGTSLGNPTGDAFDVDFVAHEMGHQFGGNHTFNGTTGSCGGGNRNAGTAYEPGSGTTVMAYAGICGAENVQSNSDDYFHTVSFDEITAFRDAGGACGVQTATGNTPPTVNAGPDFTIPTGTPFVLTASGSDADGDALTFNWEQVDLGDASPPPNNANGPLFRSRPATVSPSRTFPRLADILSGAATPWEILPTVNRTANFRAIARDNRAGGGGVNYDGMVLTFAGAPFRVTSPNGGEVLGCGCSRTVTWDVGGGSVAPTVNIRLSLDGGNTFPTVLAAGTANDGSATVTLPCTPSATARVKVEAVGNIFFDVSNANFTLQNVAPTVSLTAVGGSVDGSCQRLVTFSGTVTDDCRVDAADVAASVVLLTGNATLGVPTVNVSQVDTATVNVTGSVLVSGLTSSPATVRVRVQGADECSNPFVEDEVVSVSDTTDPAISCPAPAAVECTALGGTPRTDPQLVPFFNGASATDNCDANPVITDNAPPFFPLGLTPVTFTATDDSNNAGSCGTSVTVADTTPPVINVSVTPTVLWPPNHRMVEITATVTVADVCSVPTFVLTSITSDEPDNGTADGNTNNDIQDAAFGTPDTRFRLRAERQGSGDGRVYTIVYTATDGSGNIAIATAYVTVPHSSPHLAPAPASLRRR